MSASINFNRINPLSFIYKKKREKVMLDVLDASRIALMKEPGSLVTAQNQLGVAVVLSRLPRIVLPRGYGVSYSVPGIFDLNGLLAILSTKKKYLPKQLASNLLDLLEANKSLVLLSDKAKKNFNAASKSPAHSPKKFEMFFDSYYEVCRAWVFCCHTLNKVNEDIKKELGLPVNRKVFHENSIAEFDFNSDTLFERYLPVHKL